VPPELSMSVPAVRAILLSVSMFWGSGSGEEIGALFDLVETARPDL
jgi:hypothetical protein